MEKDAVKAAWVHQGILPLDPSKDSEEIHLDVVFPVVHGKNGEDGAIQGLLQMLNIHYVGCDVLSSALCMDKELMHIVLDESKIPCAPYLCLKRSARTFF